MFESNITLIGMPGAGKSTVGIVLAKLLCKTFIDADIVIQNNAGKRLHKIIEEIGNERFLKLENETLAHLKVHNSIISTGGSAIFAKEAMAEGLYNLGGHGSVGGMCAAIYNAMSIEGVEKLVAFMKKFAQENPKVEA